MLQAVMVQAAAALEPRGGFCQVRQAGTGGLAFIPVAIPEKGVNLELTAAVGDL